MKDLRRWGVIFLSLMMVVGWSPDRSVYAAGLAVLDQSQENSISNTAFNVDLQRFQTFTPAVTGNLDKIELHINGISGSPGDILLSVYKESSLSTPLATARASGEGWVSLDFSGTSPYLTKGTMYRMVASTEVGGGTNSYSWYWASGNPYPGGGAPAAGYDFAFRTYMIADYSLSPALSQVSSAHSTLVADGVSQTTVTVQLKDAQGSALTTGGAAVQITSTEGTISPVTDNNNGTYTATLKAPRFVGTATISASVDGNAIAGTASVQFLHGAPSLTASTIQVGDPLKVTFMTADGTSQTTIIMKLKDVYGNAVTTGGAAVAITSTLGTVSSVTNHNDGTYTATLTAPTTAGKTTIRASVDGSLLSAGAYLDFIPGALSAADSTIQASNATLTADGTSQTTVTVKLKDRYGNVLTSGGASVAITSTLGTVSSVTDNTNGTYTATLTAPMTAGTATIGATVGGSAIASTASVQFVPGAPSTANSTIQAGSATLIADGTSQTTIGVKLIDAQGNAITTGGATVGIASTLGTVSAVTDNHNGTYTATLTAPTLTGTATINASVGGSAIAATANVQFVPGAPSTANSTIQAGNATLIADGTSQTPVTVRLKDANGNTITTGGATVVITSTLGAISAVTDNHNGTYTATLTSPTTTGTATVSASVGGSAITGTASVQFVVGEPSTSNSTIVAGNATLTADGTSQTTITVKLIDALGNAQTAGGAMVGITSTLGTVSAVTDNHNGTYTATLTAPTTVGTATIGASVDGNPIASTASVEFLHGDVSALRSTVTASELVVRADGTGKASIFVKLKDDYDHPITGKRVLLQANGGSSVVQAVYDVTDADGLAVFTVSNTAAESVTYSAKEETTGLSLTQTVNVAFTYDQPPRIELQANPIAPTFGNVTVTVTASVYGQFNSISSIKWSPGSRSVSYFDTQGVAITDHFTVQDNGIYSVYAVDTVGNANVSLIEVLNIVPMSNNANLADWQLTGTGGTVNFAFDPGTTSYNIQVTHSVTGLKMLLATSDGYSIVSVNGVRVAANSITGEYRLATGNNAFEVNVKAQDGTVKKYTLNVNRSAASTNPGPSSPSSGASPSSPSPSNTIAIRINDTEVSGVATLQTGADGVKSIDVLLDSDVLKKVLPSSATVKANLSISIEDEAGLIALRLPGDAVSLLAEKGATILLKTRQGQYRLPLDEITNRKTDWTTAAEAQVTIAMGEAGGIAGLLDAANKGVFRLVGNPIHFNVHIVDHGEKREIASFGHYVERVIYLPTEATDHTVSTVIVWDEKLGARPVPTEFALVDGRRAAVIRSLTNSVYAVVSKQSLFADVQGHWAANEIGEMNSRLIVQGVDGGRFDPDAVITRAEFAALLARALGLPEGGGQASFRDVGQSSWYSGAAAAVKAYGLMDGFKDGTFGPNREVSRQEAIVMIVRALRLADVSSAISNAGQINLEAYSDRDQIGNWASDSIRAAISEGLMKGYGDELRPQKSLTRAETTVLLYRMLLKAGLINE